MLLLLMHTPAQVERWAATPCQVLLLADSVMWTRAASDALQQLAAGNSRALRALFDAASLRLETVSAVLRGQQSSAKSAAKRAAVDAAGGDGVCPVAGKLLARPGTPDTSDDVDVPKTTPRSKQTAAAAAAVASHRPNNDSTGQALGPCRAHDSAAFVTCRQAFDGPALTQQQVLGLQALAAAAACHREVAAALVAADTGAVSFDWIKQLRHYWQADTGELKVGAKCQVHEGTPPHAYGNSDQVRGD